MIKNYDLIKLSEHMATGVIQTIRQMLQEAQWIAYDMNYSNTIIHVTFKDHSVGSFVLLFHNAS